MNKNRKAAYRHLFYMAMLDIRALCRSRGRASWNPLEWRGQYVRSREAGAIADWLHNLASFAAGDFENFDESRFWSEYDYMVESYAESFLGGYKSHFERALEGAAGHGPDHE